MVVVMYQLNEFQKTAKGKSQKRGSIRQALEDCDLHPVPLELPKIMDRQRQNRCCTTAKVTAFLIILSLITMLLYAVWRIRAIEKPSETRDYDYRMIDEAEINDNDNDGNKT